MVITNNFKRGSKFNGRQTIVLEFDTNFALY